jgi:hypothetical protein
MITFPESATDDVIRNAVVAWSELLARERYTEALEMFLHTPESLGFGWTPEHLQDWISNYGCARVDFDSGEYRKVTSFHDRPEVELQVRKAIDVDRKSLYGLDPKQYLGMVHYNDVPLDGEPSDLTARFHIKKVDGGRITLEFLDIHVM